MATQNFFALLGDDENDDPAALIARAAATTVSPAKDAKKQPVSAPAPAKLPTKPAPPAQAVREAQAEAGRGRGGRSGGRGGYGNRERNFEGNYNRPPREIGSQTGEQQIDRSFNRRGGENVAAPEEGGRQSSVGARGRGRGRGRSFGISADGDERPRKREYDRRSGTGRGSEIKREGAGRGNWGTEIEQNGVQEVTEAGVVEEPTLPEAVEKPEEVQPGPEDAEKKEEEEEDKEMTLEEYEKLLTEKRKALEALKAKERKVTLDKDFESMQLVEKKNEDEVFLKLGLDKGKKKETVGKDDKSRKNVSINEFLKPADGEEYFSSGRRGRGGGRGRGSGRGAYNNYYRDSGIAPSIEDPNHFPTLGGK